NGRSTRMPTECAFPPLAAAPSLAARISPGPPPVMMSHPSAASAAATRFVSSYAKVPGRARAEPKMVTRYRSRRDGLSLVRLLTTSHNPRTESTSTCLTASSSDRLIEPPRPGCPVLALIDLRSRSSALSSRDDIRPRVRPDHLAEVGAACPDSVQGPDVCPWQRIFIEPS